MIAEKCLVTILAGIISLSSGAISNDNLGICTQSIQVPENMEKVAEKSVDETESKADRYKLSDDERKITECMVMGEAGGQSYKGKLLVAQCILNACLKENLPPSEIRIKYQYSGWKEDVNNDVKKAVEQIFGYGKLATDEPILYFYAPEYCTSDWHESRDYVLTEGGHRFFK
jgi:spore germination cell wall hydrolase CwlJ-like protein